MICAPPGTLRSIESVAQNDLTFLRIRSKKHEIMVAPGKDYPRHQIPDPAHALCCRQGVPTRSDPESECGLIQVQHGSCAV